MFEHKGGVVPGVLARPKPRRRHTTACQPLRKPRSLAYSHGMRTHKTKLALWAGLVLTAQIAHAQVTVLEDSRNYRLTTTVTGYPESPTKKVSGTNASFSVSAEITPITNNSGLLKWNRAYLTNVTIEIGSKVIKNWSPGQGDDPVTAKPFNVRWDTTEFEPGSENIKCTATMKCERLGPIVPGQPQQVIQWSEVGPITASVTVYVYNFGFSSEIPEATTISPMASKVAGFMQSMKHDTELYVNVTQAVCWSFIDQATAFYFQGHGSASPSCFGSNSPSWVIQDRLGGYSVFPQRVAAQSAELPPMNLAVIDSCLIGQNDNMSTAFLYPTDVVIDRATLTWCTNLSPLWVPLYSPVLWNHLSIKQTLAQARDAAYQLLRFESTGNQDPNDEIPDPPADISAALVIYGDANMRLHGLYNGQDDSWYEVTD
jgi:hypothetical protein